MLCRLATARLRKYVSPSALGSITKRERRRQVPFATNSTAVLAARSASTVELDSCRETGDLRHYHRSCLITERVMGNTKWSITISALPCFKKHLLLQSKPSCFDALVHITDPFHNPIRCSSSNQLLSLGC